MPQPSRLCDLGHNNHPLGKALRNLAGALTTYKMKDKFLKEEKKKDGEN
jgi:hypothetical protein